MTFASALTSLSPGTDGEAAIHVSHSVPGPGLRSMGSSSFSLVPTLWGRFCKDLFTDEVQRGCDAGWGHPTSKGLHELPISEALTSGAILMQEGLPLPGLADC